MEADTAHRFWLGRVNVTVALARGQIKAKGPVAKILKLVPADQAGLSRATRPSSRPRAARTWSTSIERQGGRRGSGRRSSRAWRPSASLATSRSAGSTPRTGRSPSAPAGPTGSPVSSATASSAPPATPTSTRRAASVARRSCPARVLVKAHMPDLATVVPVFDVESIERTAGDTLDQPLPAPGRVRERRLQQALHRHRPARPRPGRPARAVQPRLHRLDHPDSGRGRLRDHRPAALLPLAAARALQGGAEGGAALGGRHLRPAPSRDGGERPRHLQARPLERGSGAVPAEDRLLSGQPAGAGSPEAAASIRAISIFPIVE